MNSSILRTPAVAIGVLLVVCVAMLGGCGQGGGGGGAAAAALAVVVNGDSNHPQDVINAHGARKVEIEVTLPASSKDSDVVTVTLTDSAGTEAVVQGQSAGVDGGGTVMVAINATTLSDGPIDVLVEAQGTGGTASSQFPGAFMKDTVPPELPSTLTALDAQGAASSWFNMATSPAADVVATFAVAGSGQDSAQVTVTDGTTDVTSTPQTFSTTSVTFQGLDVTTLPDGGLFVDLVLTDPAMNSVTHRVRVTKDTVPPVGALSAQVSNSPSNPSDTINVATAGNVTTLVAINADAGVRNVVVSLSDSQTVVTSQPMAVPTSGGLQFVGAIDASTLADGNVTLDVTVSDLAGNTTSFAGTAALKDTLPPVAPSSLAVMGGGSNPASVINLATTFSVAVGMTWPSGSSSQDTATVTVGSVTSSAFNAPNGGGSNSVTGLNCSGVADGSVPVSITVTDPAGNPTMFNGTVASKDTVPPVAPTIARVAAGAQNGTDVVNIASVGSVNATVTFPASAPGNEQYHVVFNDGSTSAMSALMTAPAGGGTFTVGPAALGSLSDGPINVMVTVTDAAQNQSSMNGTTASKDTVPPVSPTSASVNLGAGNVANVINLSNVGAVSVSVAWPAGAPGNEAAQLVMSGGGTVNVPVAQTTGAGTTTVSGINATALADGNVVLGVTTVDAAGNIGSFVGTVASKDTVAPTGALNASVSSGGSNPANWVNAATAGSSTVNVTFGPGASGSDMVTLACSDGSTSVAGGSQAVTNGAGTVAFTGVNMTSLSDGALTLIATVTDAAGNTTVLNATGASKDVVPPVNPTQARVPAGPSNPVDMINTVTVVASSVDVTWPGDTGNESMYVILSDGTSASASPPQILGAGAQSLAFGSLNATPLSDGPVTLTVMVTDLAGNQTTWVGTAATKDTVPPVAPTSAHVASSPSNAIDVINSTTASSVSCAVVFSASGNPADVATLTLSDGTAGVSTPPQSVVPGGTVTWSSIAAGSLADGTVTLAVNIVDVAGNVTSFSGTSATKDTVQPMGATAISIPASASNPENVINVATQSSVSVAATMPPQGPGMTVACDVSDGTTTLSYTSQTAPVGGGAMSFTGLDCSSLVDGGVTATIRVTDQAGNTVSAGSTGVKDVVAPTAPMVDPTTSPTALGAQTVTGQADAGTTVSIAGGSSPASGKTSVTGQFAISVQLTVGAPNNFVVTSTDAAGNAASQTLDFTSSPLTVVQNPAAPPITFSDVSVASGLATTGTIGGGSFQDVDNDGALDLFIGGTNKLFSNNGTGTFTDITATAGTFPGGTSATFTDYDNDGDLDLVLVDGSNVTLLQNQWVPLGVRTFVDVTVASGAGASGTFMGALCGDLDGDGWNDFVVTGSTPATRMNQGVSGTFASQSLFAAAYTQMQYGLAADIIADGRPDLLFGDTTGFFWRNDGALLFTDIAATSNVSFSQSAPAGMIAVDYDNDGDLDIVVCQGGMPGNQLFVNTGSSVFMSQVGGQNCGLLAGIEGVGSWVDVCSGDVNDDGLPDLFVVRNGKCRLMINIGDRNGDRVYEYVDAASACGLVASGNGKLAQMADLDGDGDLDLFCGFDGAPNVVYRNEINNHRNLTVVAHGLGTGAGTAAKDAIGAHVELRDAAGTTILASRELSGGRGMGSQDALRAHFGVTPSEIYTVRVTFPSGAVRTSSNVVPRDLANQTLLVNE